MLLLVSFVFCVRQQNVAYINQIKCREPNKHKQLRKRLHTHTHKHTLCWSSPAWAAIFHISCSPTGQQLLLVLLLSLLLRRDCDVDAVAKSATTSVTVVALSDEIEEASYRSLFLAALFKFPAHIASVCASNFISNSYKRDALSDATFNTPVKCKQSGCRLKLD